MRIGCTGHQDLEPATVDAVRLALLAELANVTSMRGVSSLAEGADQLFAQCVLDLGGALEAVIPCTDYESTFLDPTALDNYRRLRLAADSVDELPFDRPGEEAFWQAGRRVVEQCDRLVAVWDGQPAGGHGGTAEIVEYAQSLARPISIIWPEGSERAS